MMAWKENHKGDCKLNHNGSAPAMEGAGAKTCYTEYYGDGDSKAYSEVRNIWGQRSSQI